MALFGGISGSKSKSKYTENQVQQNTIDPFFSQQGRDTISAFDRLTSGVMGRYGSPRGVGGQASGGLSYGGIAPMWDLSADPGHQWQLGQVDFNEPIDFNEPTLDEPGGPDSFVAGFGDTTTGAMNDIRSWQGSADQLRALAAGIIPQGLGQVGQVGQIGAPGQLGHITSSQIAPVVNAEARTAREYMDQYMNPYLKDVVDTSLADFDVGADRTAAAARMRRGAATAFGDRAAIADAVLGGELNRGRGALSANLRSGAFNTAATLGAGDAGRFTSVSQTNAGAANARSMSQAGLDMQARMAKLNTDALNIDNQFRTDEANADIEAGNIDRQIDADQFSINAKLEGTGISADLIKDADATDLLAIKNRLEVGMMEDENAQARLQEPLELIMQKLALLSGLPYDTTSTTNTSGRKSGSSIGFSIGSK